MTIKTLFEIGDYMEFEGGRYRVQSVHLYKSENVQTERYYLGDHRWITIKKEIKQ